MIRRVRGDDDEFNINPPTRPRRASSKRPSRPKPKGSGQPIRTRGPLTNGRAVEGARGQSAVELLLERSRILGCPKRAPSTARPLSRGPRALVGLPFSVWTGACYWHGVGGYVFNSSSSSPPGRRNGTSTGGRPRRRRHRSRSTQGRSCGSTQVRFSSKAALWATSLVVCCKSPRPTRGKMPLICGRFGVLASFTWPGRVRG